MAVFLCGFMGCGKSTISAVLSKSMGVSCCDTDALIVKKEGMSIPDDAEQDIYDIKLIYERNGEQQIVSLEEYDQLDSTWQFVDQQTTLIKKGYEPPIHDFTIDTEEDGDITEEILADDNYTFIIVAYDLTLMNRSEEEKFDSAFPGHPLTEARNFARFLIENN